MKAIMSRELVEAASAVLARSSVSELRSLRVDQREGYLQLSGHVKSFYHKQLAQESIRQLVPDIRLVNCVSVMR
jgi:hypothetical protein